MKNNAPFAEVIESSLIRFRAQSWEWDTAPTFGSLVSITEKEIVRFGIVYQIETGSRDTARTPFAYQKSEEELKREHPQIFEFLSTTFSCLNIGYEKKGSIYHLIPSEPAKIHAFVSAPPLSLCQQFFSKTAYLHLFFNLQQELFNLDELLLAVTHYQITHLKMNPHTTISHLMKTYSLLTGNDYRRTKLFLERVEQFL